MSTSYNGWEEPDDYYTPSRFELVLDARFKKQRPIPVTMEIDRKKFGRESIDKVQLRTQLGLSRTDRIPKNLWRGQHGKISLSLMGLSLYQLMKKVLWAKVPFQFRKIYFISIRITSVL